MRFHLPPGVQAQRGAGAARAAGAAGAQQGWALAARRQTAKKEARDDEPAEAPVCRQIRRQDQGCNTLREKGPKARDSGSRAGREGGARTMTREGSPEAEVRLWAT